MLEGERSYWLMACPKLIHLVVNPAELDAQDASIRQPASESRVASSCRLIDKVDQSSEVRVSQEVEVSVRYAPTYRPSTRSPNEP
jgi:hypothetical protein